MLRGNAVFVPPSDCRRTYRLGPTLPWRTRGAGKFGIPCGRRFVIIEILQYTTLDLLTEHSLNALDYRLVLPTDESEGVARLCGPAGPSDAVRVGIRRVRDIVVDNVGYAQARAGFRDTSSDRTARAMTVTG